MRTGAIWNSLAMSGQVPDTEDGNHGIPVPDYVDENVSTKVVRIIQSYVGVVNKIQNL